MPKPHLKKPVPCPAISGLPRDLRWQKANCCSLDSSFPLQKRDSTPRFISVNFLMTNSVLRLPSIESRGSSQHRTNMKNRFECFTKPTKVCRVREQRESFC